MGTKSMGRLLDAVFDKLGKLGIVEPAVSASLKAPKSPLPGLLAHQVMTVYLHDLVEHLDCHIVDVADVREDGTDDIFHPCLIRGTESSVPVVKDSKLHGYMAAGSTLDTCAALLDLFAKIKRPFRVGSWCVQDGSDIVFQYD